MSTAEDRLNDPWQRAPAPAVTLPTVITGQVDASGTILAGSGFTVNHSGTGTYVITFTTPFSAPPTVIPGMGATVAGRSIRVNPATTVSTATVEITNNASSGTLEDQPFNFIAYQTQ